MQSSERFDAAWQNLSHKLNQAKDDQIANLNLKSMQEWKDQLDKYNQLVGSTNTDWSHAYSKFTEAWKDWAKQKAETKKVDSASDTQLLALTPAQLQSWKNTIEAQNKLISKTNEYTAFEKA